MTKLLIVEDEPAIRLALSSELSAQGYEVIEAPTAEDGWDLFRQHSDIAATVTDIHLPGQMNGYDFVRAIRAERPDALVIIMSGLDFAPPEDFDEHVIIERKPCDVRKIGHILQSRVGRTPDAA